MDFKRFHQTKYYILTIVLLLIAMILTARSLTQDVGQEFKDSLFNLIFQFALVCYFVMKIVRPHLKEDKENINSKEETEKEDLK